MKRVVAVLGRITLRGYSLFLLLLLWLVSISVNASGGVLGPMYGVIAMYGSPEPEYGVIAEYGAPFPYSCTGTSDKVDDVTCAFITDDREYER